MQYVLVLSNPLTPAPPSREAKATQSPCPSRTIGSPGATSMSLLPAVVKAFHQGLCHTVSAAPGSLFWQLLLALGALEHMTGLWAFSPSLHYCSVPCPLISLAEVAISSEHTGHMFVDSSRLPDLPGSYSERHQHVLFSAPLRGP